MHAAKGRRARYAAAAPDVAVLECEFPEWSVAPSCGRAPWSAWRSLRLTAEQRARGAREVVTASSAVLLRDELLVEADADEGARRVLLG